MSQPKPKRCVCETCFTAFIVETWNAVPPAQRPPLARLDEVIALANLEAIVSGRPTECTKP